MTLSLTLIQYHDIALGSGPSDAGHPLTITARLFELPAVCDYWLGCYAMSHSPDGERKFTLVIPKRIAATRNAAIDIMKGPALTRVQEFCDKTATQMSALGPFFSKEGWVLT